MGRSWSTASGTEGSLLIQKTIYSTLVKAVNKKLIPRELAARYIGPEEIKGSTIDIDLETPDSFTTPLVAEGAAFPTLQDMFTSVNVRPLKYGVRPTFSRELMEDGKFSMVDVHINRAGQEIAENETGLIISALDGAANTVAGGTQVTTANWNTAFTNLEKNDFKATDILAGPDVIQDIRNTDIFTESNKYGSDEMQRTGFIGKLLGCNLYEISQASGLITSTTAYVIDREQAYAIAEKRPLSVDNYDDKTRDLTGLVVSQRVAVALLRSAAVCKITSS